jgi:hypothetical protein
MVSNHSWTSSLLNRCWNSRSCWSSKDGQCRWGKIRPGRYWKGGNLGEALGITRFLESRSCVFRCSSRFCWREVCGSHACRRSKLPCLRVLREESSQRWVSSYENNARPRWADSIWQCQIEIWKASESQTIGLQIGIKRDLLPRLRLWRKPGSLGSADEARKAKVREREDTRVGTEAHWWNIVWGN